MGKMIRNILLIVVVLGALGSAAVFFLPLPGFGKAPDLSPGRVIIPQAVSGLAAGENQAEYEARMDMATLKAPLNDGEILAAILNEDFDNDQIEEQIIAYRNLPEPESPVYLAYFDNDERGYKRAWTAPAAATRPGTLSLYTQDLIGDRGFCVLLSGMNSQDEHTLTIFRKIPPEESAAGVPPFFNIAEIRIGGSIVVREVERPQAYQLGMAKGQSHTISAFGRDPNSTNLLDQIEISYVYNESKGIYEESGTTRIPGTQIEQRRVRELLGNTNAFEEFVTGLWYYVSPQGTIDVRQYIYFDPLSREIIFYGDETQQVFTWQNSAASRYGIYVASQNISVSTLRRSIDIELESLDSIRIKVFEDVRIKMGVSAPWDGSYRKAGSPENQNTAPVSRNSFVSAIYDGPMGKISFDPAGNFEIISGGSSRKGKYAFFYLDDRRLLEFRNLPAAGTAPQNAGIPAATGEREIYLVESISDETNAEVKTPDEAGAETDGTAAPLPARIITLSRVRLGARGIQMLHEGTITLTLSGG